MSIYHRTQPTKNSCMATCIAMLADLDVDFAYTRWHDKFQNKSAWLDTALDVYNIPYFYGSPREARLNKGFAYLLCVPSLNIRGGLHQILALYPYSAEPGHITILDPAKGRGVFHYVYHQEPDEEDKEVELISWTIDLAIPLCEGDVS